MVPRGGGVRVWAKEKVDVVEAMEVTTTWEGFKLLNCIWDMC